MTDWFRSWHGAPTDPKWLGIARRAGVIPGIAVAVAWALMDRASQAEDRGSIEGFDAEGLAYFYGCEPEQVAAIIAAMEDKGMILGGRLTSWEKRQPKREDDSSKRVREYRERVKQREERDVTPRNAPDTDTDTDTDTSSLRSEDAPRVIEKRTPRDELGQVLDAEHVEAVIQHRQKIRKPLTAHAAKLLSAKFAQCPNPNEAADAMVSNGWQGFEIEWMANRSVPRRQAQAPPVRERTIFDAIDDFTGKNDHGLSAGKTIEHDDGGDYPPHVHVIAPPQRGRR